MAQVAFSIRMDENLKRDFSQFCNDIGMSMSTAFVVFAKETLREQRIPFALGRRGEAVATPRKPGEYDWRRDSVARGAMEAFAGIRADIKARGVPEMTTDEIDDEIAAARRERRERKAREATEKAVPV